MSAVDDVRPETPEGWNALWFFLTAEIGILILGVMWYGWGALVLLILMGLVASNDGVHTERIRRSRQG